MTAPPPLDRQVLDDLVAAIGAEGTRAVCEVFLSETKTYLTAIAQAAAQPADAALRDRARRAAHSLKSGAGQIGAVTVAAAALAVEAAATDPTADLVQPARHLEECTAEAMSAFSRMLAADPGRTGIG